MKSNTGIERSIRNILNIILILNIISLIVFILYSYKNFGFNSDSAVRVILANEIYESRNYFPKDWFFVNRDIWVFSAHTLIIPLLRYFSVGYGLYAFSSIVMTAVIFLSINALLVILKTEKITRLLILVVFTSGISLAITENLFGQISYGLMVMYYCLLLYGSIDILSNKGKSIKKSTILVIGLLLVVFWSNPLRGMVFFVIPLVAALACYVFISYKQESIRHEIKYIKYLVYIVIASIAIGVVLNRITLNNVQMNSGVTQLQWLSLSEMIKRVSKIFTSLFFILGGEPYANRSLFTISGFYDGFRLVVAICFIVLIPISIRQIFKTEDNRNLKIITIFTCSAFAIVAFLMISTNIYNARYLLPAVVLMIIVVIVLPFDLKNNSLFDALRILTIIGFITNTLVINTGYWTTYRASEVHNDDSQTFNDVSKLAKYLESINLKYGYATFWNAGSVTVLSDNKVQVRQIYIENGIPQKFKWLSSNGWYARSSAPMKTFLLLANKESEGINWKLLKDEYKLEPESEINYEDYKIYIFNENISNKLINWQN